MKKITLSVTDSNGKVHTRTTAREYTHAVVFRNSATWHGSYAHALKKQSHWMGHGKVEIIEVKRG